MKKIIVIALMGCLVLTGCQKGAAVEAPATDQEMAEETNLGTSTEEENPVADVDLSEIEMKDINGNTLDGSVFKEKKLTVLNLWATWCGPCVEEMPELEEVWQEMKEQNVQFIGLTIDSDLKEIQQVKENLKITYPLIAESKELTEEIASQFDYVPVTLFVDEEGKVMDTIIAGGTTGKALQATIEGLLNE